MAGEHLNVCTHYCVTYVQMHCVWTKKMRKMHDNEQDANEACVGGGLTFNIAQPCRAASGGSIYSVWFAHCNGAT